MPSPGLNWARARIVSLRGDVVKSLADRSPPYGYTTHRGRRLVLSSPHLSAETLPWYLDAIVAFNPDLLWIWPTMAANLLRALALTGKRLRIPAVLTSSERLDPAVHLAITREFGARVIDYYGQAERSCLASSTDTGRYYFNPAYGRVELMPSDEDEISDGKRNVAIVSTGYWNEAMPLVRYDTGDQATVPANADRRQLDTIALGLEPFFGIAGRRGEFVYGVDGTQICGLNQLPREVGNLLQLQVVQDQIGRITIRVLAGPSFGLRDRLMLERNARSKIPEDTALQIEMVDRLETTAQGKAPFIIRRAGAPGPHAELVGAD